MPVSDTGYRIWLVEVAALVHFSVRLHISYPVTWIVEMLSTAS